MGVKHGLTRREEHGLRVFEIRVLRTGPIREGNRGMKKTMSRFIIFTLHKILFQESNK